MIPGFYWLIDGELAGCSRPGGQQPHGPQRGAGSPDDALPTTEGQEGPLDRDLSWLRRQGISAILSLTETALDEDVAQRHGLAILHLPVPDLHAPAPEQFLRALAFIDHQRAEGRAVVVHCLVGQGRTGTVLAAYRIRGGMLPDDALRELRTVCPGAIGSPEQEQALHLFATRRDWIV